MYYIVRESSNFQQVLHKREVNKGDFSTLLLLTKINALQYKTWSENADRIFVLKVKSRDDDMNVELKHTRVGILILATPR